MNRTDRAKKLIDEGNLLDAAELLSRAEAAKIKTPSTLKEYLTKWMFKKVEYFLVCTLDANNRIVKIHEVAKGTLDGVEVHPRDVYRFALIDNAASIILAHNHPGGTKSFSRKDLLLTRKMKRIGELMDIPVLDHVIIYGKEIASAAEMGLLDDDIR